MQVWDLLVLQLPPCLMSSPPQLPVSAHPISLNECFFFNSLVVRPPYSSIFWQFWLFFVFKFVVVLLLVVRGGKVYLPMPLSWPEVLPIYLFLEGKGARKGERNINLWLPLMPPLLVPGQKPRHMPWESNWRPFGSQAGTQSTKPHQPGLTSESF